MNVVKELTIGNTRIRIADDYCGGMSEEDTKKALREIARTAKENITAGAAGRNA